LSGVGPIRLVDTRPWVDLNIDGDLKVEVDHDWSWDRSMWFAGDPGETTFTLDFMFEGLDAPYGTADINFKRAGGNRPFPHQASDRGTAIEVRVARDIYLTCDIFLEEFSYDPTSMMRMALVAVCRKTDGKPYYFEADIKDSDMALETVLPLGPVHWPEGSLIERVFYDIPIGEWVHVLVDFGAWMVEEGMRGRPLYWIYLVNECLREWIGKDGKKYTGSGDGHIKYKVKNFRLLRRVLPIART